MLFALAAGLSYGVSDFFSGLAARRLGTLLATAVTFLAATAVLGLASLAAPGVWSSGAVGAGVVAGIAGLVGFLAFYAALAVGPISLLSPGMALFQSAVPVVFGIAVLGERLGVAGWAGVGVALLAGGLLGAPGGQVGRLGLRALGFAVVAGLGLGASVVALDYAPADAGLVPVLLSCAVGLVPLAVLVASVRFWPRARSWGALLDGGPLEPRGGRLLAVLGGALLGAADGLLMVGLRSDALAVVSVLLGLYPLSTVLLAWVVLRERLRPRQLVGVGLALLGSVLLGVS